MIQRWRKDGRYAGASSISARLRSAFTVLVALLVIPAVMSLAMMAYYAQRYHGIISQVERVASLKPVVEETIPDEVWSVVAGRQSFGEGQQYLLANEVRRELDQLTPSAQQINLKELIVARRTMDTLVDKIDVIGQQIQAGEPVSKNEEALEEVRSVAALVGEMLETYVDAEIAVAAQTSEQLHRMVIALLWALVLLLGAALVFSALARKSVGLAIHRPIQELEKFAASLAGGDLGVRAPDSQVEELRELTSSLNSMASRLQSLIDVNRREQENLKKAELRTLQAQIAPHFLYNTLDAIVWLAEAHRTDEVIHITRALSDFYRISLSQGKDWIPLSEEVKHLTGYLTIQKIRYRDILDYRIDIPESLYGEQILKLLLQPLVENAIYHGIKHRRGRGLVTVTGREADGQLWLSVRDDGAGMTPERLREVRQGLGGAGEGAAGYGLYNVNQRIKLYYNQAQGIEIHSNQSGTTISLHVPVRRTE
ncbi:MAG TPA: histidine kinase [Candidatus Excrementavichristensenella intestinipullorum]|nr:histidine kinase [Candidatus Excrementavichristensenella intestinipullorum]